MFQPSSDDYQNCLSHEDNGLFTLIPRIRVWIIFCPASYLAWCLWNIHAYVTDVDYINF